MAGRVSHVFTVAVLTLALLASGAVPAAAASRTYQDARGDDPSGTDIRQVTAVNRARLHVKMRFDDLAPRNRSVVFVYVGTDVHPGPEYLVRLPSHGPSVGRVTRARRWRPTRPVLCDFGWFIAFDTDRTRLHMTRECVEGDRGPVRVAVKVVSRGGVDWSPRLRRLHRPPVRRG